MRADCLRRLARRARTFSARVREVFRWWPHGRARFRRSASEAAFSALRRCCGKNRNRSGLRVLLGLERGLGIATKFRCHAQAHGSGTLSFMPAV